MRDQIEPASLAVERLVGEQVIVPGEAPMEMFETPGRELGELHLGKDPLGEHLEKISARLGVPADREREHLPGVVERGQRADARREVGGDGAPGLLDELRVAHVDQPERGVVLVDDVALDRLHLLADQEQGVLGDRLLAEAREARRREPRGVPEDPCRGEDRRDDREVEDALPPRVHARSMDSLARLVRSGQARSGRVTRERRCRGRHRRLAPRRDSAGGSRRDSRSSVRARDS